jgi:hypothetical protein
LKRQKKKFKQNSPNSPWNREVTVNNLNKKNTRLPKSDINNNHIKKERTYDLQQIYNSFSLKLPRLLSAAKDFAIGQDTLVDFLSSKGFDKDNLQPTAKLTIEMYFELTKQFKPDRLKEFEKEDLISEVLSEEFIVLSYKNGRYILQQHKPDGTIVYSDGLETGSGLFFPFFTSISAALKELEELINSPDVSEDDIQKLLERYPELILDNDYEKAIPQARIVVDQISWEADFVLVPFNQLDFCKILELKLPKEKLFSQERNGHLRLSAKLYHSLQQIKDYHNAFNSQNTRKHFRERYGTDVYRPELQLIIGRKGDMQLKQNFIDTQRELNIKIVDWDTFLEKGKRRFKVK